MTEDGGTDSGADTDVDSDTDTDSGLDTNSVAPLTSGCEGQTLRELLGLFRQIAGLIRGLLSGVGSGVGSSLSILGCRAFFRVGR